MRDFRPGYAIVRIDRYIDDEQGKVTIKRVVWDLALAESEVQRLNALEVKADSPSFYFWQYTRVDEQL